MTKTYKNLVACWNCDNKQFINIGWGKNVPDYLQKEKISCESCGCDNTLLFFKEYLMVERSAHKIMNDGQDGHEHHADHFA